MSVRILEQSFLRPVGFSDLGEALGNGLTTSGVTAFEAMSIVNGWSVNRLEGPPSATSELVGEGTSL